jgi:Ni2+-binding GTPase involved in maturation of urease and hydrogenase
MASMEARRPFVSQSPGPGAPAVPSVPVSPDPVPMGAAPFVWRSDGRPDWRVMWESFCDLALHGGPPHRGPDRALRAPAGGEGGACPPAMLTEIRRGIWETTGLYAEAAEPGWLAVTCESPAMAAWLAGAIVLENVEARAQDDRLLLPAGTGYRLDDEVKSTITVVAKTHHHWDAHGPGAEAAAAAGPRVQFRCVRCGLDFLVARPAGTTAGEATCPSDGSRLARWDGPPTVRPPRGARVWEHAHGPGLPLHAHGPVGSRPVAPSAGGVPRPLVVGVGGPAGSGKTTLIEALRRRLAGRYTIVVGETDVAGGQAPPPDLRLVERTGERAATTFSPDLVDATIGLLALPGAGGRVAVPAGACWRLLVVNSADSSSTPRRDLPPLEQGLRDRTGGPVIVTELAAPGGVDPVVDWLERELLLGL